MENKPAPRPKIDARKAGGRPVEMTQEDLDRINRAGASPTTGSDSPGPEEEADSEVPYPDLTPEEAAQVYEMQALIEEARVGADLRLQHLKDRQAELDRNTAVSDAANEKEPIQLRDLILKAWVEQGVHIDEDYFMRFRTLPHRADFVIEAVSSRIAKRTPEADNKANRIHLQRVAAMTASLAELCGAPGPAQRLEGMWGDPDKAASALEEEVLKMLEKSPVLIEDLNIHHSLFVARVRKVVATAGYRRQEVGKS